MGLFWNLALVFFALAVLPLEPLSAFREIIVLIMSALVAVAVFDESRRVARPN